MSRSFTIEKSDVGETGGRFMGSEPYRVAAKVARSLFDSAGSKKKHHEIRFTIRETTADSPKKSYTYIGIKKSLHKPIIVKRGDVEIKIRHTYHVKSCQA